MSMSQAKPIEKVFMPERQLQPPDSQGKNFPEPVHARRLSVALQLVGVMFTFGIYPLTLVWPSGWAWHTGYTSHYLQMILGVYATLGIFLLIASRKPLAHLSLIWFTVWSSVVHAGIMAAQALANPEHLGHLWGDVPALFLVAGVLSFLTVEEDIDEHADTSARYREPEVALAHDVDGRRLRPFLTLHGKRRALLLRTSRRPAGSTSAGRSLRVWTASTNRGSRRRASDRRGYRRKPHRAGSGALDAERSPARFCVADAESLPFPDASFDVVASLVGAMFAPRPQLVARELARVCAPGGTIAMANWTAEGFVGKMFHAIAKFIAPSGTPSPLLWGDETVVRERLGPQICDLKVTRRQYPFDYPFPPSHVVNFFRLYYGPVNRAFASLDRARPGIRPSRRVERTYGRADNCGHDGFTLVAAEYLEAIANSSLVRLTPPVQPAAGQFRPAAPTRLEESTLNCREEL